MAYYLNCEINIEGLKPIRFAKSIEVISRADELQDTCTIQLPNLKGQSEKLIQAGQSVSVKIGYNGNLIEEFKGYAVGVKPSIPFEIKCEDQLYLLKREGQITKSYESIALKDLLKELIPDATISDKVPAVTLENFLIENATKAQVLSELKDKYALQVYYRKGVLFIGVPFTENAGEQVVKYHFQKNIISDDLQYQKEGDVSIKVKAISILKDNSKIEAEFGDAEGEERTLHFYGITSETELRKVAEAELSRYRYEGYKGGFTGFGIPYVQHSQVVSLTDERYPNRPQGNYLVKAVKTTWGTSGFRREIDLGLKV